MGGGVTQLDDLYSMRSSIFLRIIFLPILKILFVYTVKKTRNFYNKSSVNCYCILA